MDLAQLIYRHEQGRSEASQEAILHILKENAMIPLYSNLCAKFSWKIDHDMVEDMRLRNDAELKILNSQVEDAVKNAGDVEVIDALFAKAKYYSKIGGWSDAISTFDKVISHKKCSTGKQVDAMMEKAKIALFTMNATELKAHVNEAKRLNDAGGDWDRRNRLKVYEAFYWLIVHNVKKASDLFMESVATFTCTELCTYKQFMFYALAICVITLNRNQLRKQLINDPHVITIIPELPSVQMLINGIYNCDYAGVFSAILGLYPELVADRFLNPLSVYLVREIRILSYSQFLEAYKSVMLSSMATSFSVTPAFLDKELSRFIASGRLTAKIDKVGDMIETTRLDKKNSQYQDVVKKGDSLLNRIQKLVRVVDV